MIIPALLMSQKRWKEREEAEEKVTKNLPGLPEVKSEEVSKEKETPKLETYQPDSSLLFKQVEERMDDETKLRLDEQRKE